MREAKKMTFRSAAAIVAALLFAGRMDCVAGNSPEFRVVDKIRIGGEGGWDYLSFDDASRRLFVSHGDRVVVVNAESGTVVGEIRKTEGVHGVAVAGDFGRGYVSCGRSGTVSVFDLKTLSVFREIRAGINPDAIVYDPFSRRVFAFNGGSRDATVIDAKSDSVVVTLPLGGKPEFAVTDGAGAIFVNIEDKSEIVALDPVALKILSRWSIAPGEEPSGLAIDVANKRLFSVCSNKLMVIVDAEHGKVLSTVPIGSRVDGCAFDPGLRLAFSSNGEGTVTVVREESPTVFSVAQTVRTEVGARTITVDPATHALYLSTAEFGKAPEPTAGRPRPRPPIVPGSFVVLKVSPAAR